MQTSRKRQEHYPQQKLSTHVLKTKSKITLYPTRPEYKTQICPSEKELTAPVWDVDHGFVV